MLEEIRKIKIARAEAVLDCGIDPMINECHSMLLSLMPNKCLQSVISKLVNNKEI